MMTTETQTKDKFVPEATPTTWKEWVYQVAAGVSNTILAVLGMGLLLSTLGTMLHFQALNECGLIAQRLMAPALGMAVAVMLRTTTLVTGATMIAATVGANGVYFTAAPVAKAVTATGWLAPQAAGSAIMTIGQPVSAVMAAVIAAVFGKWLTGKTPLDLVLVPFAVAIVGSLAGLLFGYVTTPALNWVSERLADTMGVNPILGSMLVAGAWFLFLMTPASSAALAIAVQLDPMSAGAALIGTTVGFSVFTAMSYNQNNLGGNIAQSLVTPKVQFAKLLKSPLLAVGPLVISMVMGPIAVVGFGLKVPFLISGLGLNSLIAPLWLWANNKKAFFVVLVFGVVIPAILGWAYYRFLKMAGKNKPNDLYLEEV